MCRCVYCTCLSCVWCEFVCVGVYTVRVYRVCGVSLVCRCVYCTCLSCVWCEFGV